MLIRQYCSSVLTKYVFPQPVGLVMFDVNGCLKGNSFSTSLVAAAMVVVDIHDGSLTAGMSVLVMTTAKVDMHDGSVDTVDWFRVCFENV